jgi:(S)-ureidoglycine aminohydrolase
MKYFFTVTFIFAVTFLNAQNNSLLSGVYSFTKTISQTTKTGEKKDILKGSTLDVSSFQIHTSTLLPGLMNHPSVAYDNKEELVIVKEGNLTVHINDSIKTLTAGSIALMEAGNNQSFSNTSANPVTYYIISFVGKLPVNIIRGSKNGSYEIKDWNELPVKQTTKGESRQVFEKPTSMFSKLSIHVTNLNANEQSHLPHTHRAEEIMLLLKGSGQLQVGSNFYTVDTGDIMFINANNVHAFKNTGNTQCSYYAIQWNL